MDPVTLQMVIAILGVLGATAGAYAAVKTSIAVLEQRMASAEREITWLRESRLQTAETISRMQGERGGPT